MNTNPLKRDWIRFRERFGHRAAQAANDGVLLDGDQRPGLAGSLEQQVTVKRLEGMQLQQARIHALQCQFFGRPGTAPNHRTGRNERQVTPVSQGQPLADFQFRASLENRQSACPARWRSWTSPW